MSGPRVPVPIGATGDLNLRLSDLDSSEAPWQLVAEGPVDVSASGLSEGGVRTFNREDARPGSFIAVESTLLRFADASGALRYFDSIEVGNRAEEGYTTITHNLVGTPGFYVEQPRNPHVYRRTAFQCGPYVIDMIILSRWGSFLRGEVMDLVGAVGGRVC